MKVYIVDRFEENIVICEDKHRHSHQLPISSLPEGVKEGDCLNVFDDGTVTVDNDRTRVSRERVISLMNSAFYD